MSRISPQLANDIRDAAALGYSGFNETALEKDVHISSVLNLITLLPQINYSLVFCGGTSLIKTHRMIERMSEDVDFKIILEEGLSTSSCRKLLSQIKSQFLTLLETTDYSHGGFLSENNNSHFQIDIEYESAFVRSTALRSAIKVEFTQATTVLPTPVLTATTLIGDVAANYLNPIELKCVSLEEIMAEKVISFLRRHLPYFRETTGQYEGQLVRHIYDVHMLSQADLDYSAARRATEHAYSQDALRYANTSKKFASEPREELLISLGNLNRAEITTDYEVFVADLLNPGGPECEEACESFVAVAQRLLN
jgi:predicted nucleotidyltransferase component of viral defense system